MIPLRRSRACRQALQGAMIVIGLTIFLPTSWAQAPEAAKKPRAAIELEPLQSQLHDAKHAQPTIKPGHGSTLYLPIVTQHDVTGMLRWELNETAFTIGTHPLSSLAAYSGPLGPLRIQFRRRVQVPAGQVRRIELPFLEPYLIEQAVLQTELVSDRLGDEQRTQVAPLRIMPPEQYDLLVLTPTASRYAYLASLPAISFANETYDGTISAPHYRLLTPSIESVASVPRGLLHWTTTAIVVWDEFDPALLDAEQRAAMLDWLHWGGRLIVDGPGSLDTLRGSFLAAYLPATTTETATFDNSALAPFREWKWMFGETPLTVEKPWSGVKLVSHPTSATLIESPVAPLVVERAVGRGSIVVTAFRLNQRELVQWPGLDALWHVVLMRRAPRRFTVQLGSQVPQVDWAKPGSTDGELETDLRLLTRYGGKPELSAKDSDLPSICSWTDRCSLASEAADALIESAKIEAPSQATIAKVVFAYALLVLPGNWCLFRLFGRPEWSWLTLIPVSLLYTAGIVTYGQIDLKLVRVQHEIVIAEMHVNHPRAHVTRYASLYAPLGTSFTVDCVGRDSAAIPFLPTDKHEYLIEHNVIVERTTTDDAAALPLWRWMNFVVPSNSTRLLHAEQMLDLGSLDIKSLGKDRLQLTSQQQFPLTYVVATVAGVLSQGELQPQRPVEFAPSEFTPLESATFVEQLAEINVRPLLRSLLNDLRHDEIRLIAWREGSLPGVELHPTPEQQRSAVVVVAHLRLPPRGPLEPDVALRPQIKTPVQVP